MDEPCGGLHVGRTWVGEFSAPTRRTKMSQIPRVPTREAMTLVEPRKVDSEQAWGSVQWLDLDMVVERVPLGLIPFATMAMFVEFASDDELHLAVVAVAVAVVVVVHWQHPPRECCRKE